MAIIHNPSVILKHNIEDFIYKHSLVSYQLHCETKAAYDGDMLMGLLTDQHLRNDEKPWSDIKNWGQHLRDDGKSRVSYNKHVNIWGMVGNQETDTKNWGQYLRNEGKSSVRHKELWKISDVPFTEKSDALPHNLTMSLSYVRCLNDFITEIWQVPQQHQLLPRCLSYFKVMDNSQSGT